MGNLSPAALNGTEDSLASNATGRSALSAAWLANYIQSDSNGQKERELPSNATQCYNSEGESDNVFKKLGGVRYAKDSKYMDQRLAGRFDDRNWMYRVFVL